MTRKFGITLTALTMVISLGGVNGALAKAHDQGRADGTFNADADTGAKSTIDFLTETFDLSGHGVSDLVKDGAEGEQSSTAGSGNSVDPVVPD